MPGLYAQRRVGVVALDPRHKTHNIPGKFLSCMQSGLPVLATINADNDLAELIQAERVGEAGYGGFRELSGATINNVAACAGTTWARGLKVL